MDGYVDTNLFKAAIDRLGKEVPVAAAQIGNDTMALTLLAMIRATPPIAVGQITNISPGESVDNLTDRQRGERRVEKDIRSIIYGVPRDQWKQFRADWIAKNGGKPVGHLFKTNDGKVYAADYDLIDSDGSQIAAFHDKRRSKKTGRVFTAGTQRGKSVGKWKFTSRLHAKDTKVDAYIREKKKRVGFTKAGWCKAFEHFSTTATAGMVSKARPAWIWRHAGSAPGSYVAPSSGSADVSQFRATNAVPWISETNAARIVDYVLGLRLKDITSGWMEKRYKKALQKAFKGN